jgi:hypothetical protein
MHDLCNWVFLSLSGLNFTHKYFLECLYTSYMYVCMCKTLYIYSLLICMDILVFLHGSIIDISCLVMHLRSNLTKNSNNGS